MGKGVEFVFNAVWRKSAFLWIAALIALPAAAAVRTDAPASVAEIRSLPETTETAQPERPEIRDYSWNHGNKERILSRHLDSTRAYRTLQLDTEAAATTPLTAWPALINAFPGNVHDDFDPPDPILAAGPAHVMSVVNYTINIYNKTGQRVLFKSLHNWFITLPHTSTSFVFDPKVIYDQYDSRYILMCLAYAPHQKTTFVFFSVSQNEDPTGKWAFWELDMQKNNTVNSGLYADFPGLGYDQQAIYITANMLDKAGNFKYAKIRVLKKSEAYSFQPLSWHDFFNMVDATGAKAINVQPAQSFGTTPAEFLVSTNAVSGNKLTVWAIRNPTGSPTLGKRSIPVSPYVFPPAAPQKGGGASINTGDAGVVNVVFRAGKLYTAHAISFDFGGGPVAAIRYYEIGTNGVVTQEITFGNNGLYEYYPAVMEDSLGNVCIVYNRSGATEFAGIRFTGRKPTDPPGTLQPGGVLRLGAANYNDPVLDGLNPWGDYNGAALDPVDETFWIFSEFALTPTAWATRVGHLRP